MLVWVVVLSLLLTTLSQYHDEYKEVSVSTKEPAQEWPLPNGMEIIAQQLVKPGGIIYYLNSGYGKEFVQLTHLVGEAGAAIAVSMTEQQTVVLRHALEAEGLWSRTLILAATSITESDPHAIINPKQNPFVHIHQMLHEHCPNLIFFHYNTHYHQELYLILKKLFWFITNCHSPIYFHDSQVALVLWDFMDLFPLMEYHSLLLANDSVLVYHGSHSIHSNITDHTIGGSLSSYLDRWSTPRKCSYGRQQDSVVCSEAIDIDFEVLLPATSLTYYLFRQSPDHLPISLKHMSLWMPVDSEGVGLRCAMWTLSAMTSLEALVALSPISHSFRQINGNESISEVWWRESDEIIRNCVLFSEKRLSTLQRVDQLQQTPFLHPLHVAEDPSHKSYDVKTFNISSWLKRPVFGMTYDAEVCGEPIWCEYTQYMQQKIYNWQNPPLTHSNHTKTSLDGRPLPRTCATAKYLVYEVPAGLHGLGSMMLIISAIFRYAICLDRILVLSIEGQSPKLVKWRHPGCGGSVWSCYFLPTTHCEIPFDVLANARVYLKDTVFDRYPLRDEPVIILKESFPDHPEAKCKLCYDSWDLSSSFWDGTYMPYYNHEIMDNHNEPALFPSFTSGMKLTWISQFLRYLVRPRPWLVQAIDQLIVHSLHSPVSDGHDDRGSSSSDSGSWSPVQLPSSFVSLHVRHGYKYLEVPLQPLSRYMTFLRKKLPGVRDIFVSTETESVIGDLIEGYPDYRFHFLRYPRMELLYVQADTSDIEEIPGRVSPGNFVDEMMFSLANLYVASEGDGFVGTLSSNWCMMIHHLERTRGDGGFDYYSMDIGSAYTMCF